MLLDKVKSIEEWIEDEVIQPISAIDLFFCIWAMTQAYADFASQMTIMKKQRVLEQVDYDTAKATIVQLVLGGLGLWRQEAGGGERGVTAGKAAKAAKIRQAEETRSALTDAQCSSRWHRRHGR